MYSLELLVADLFYSRPGPLLRQRGHVESWPLHPGLAEAEGLTDVEVLDAEETFGAAALFALAGHASVGLPQGLGRLWKRDKESEIRIYHISNSNPRTVMCIM